MNLIKIISLVLLFAVGTLFTHCNEEQEVKTDLEFGAGSSGGAGSPGSAAVQNTSKTAFRNTVYQLTTKHCAACHATQVPQHAHSDVDRAHDQVVDNFKVNFGNLGASRIVAKIRDEFHGCWNDCQKDSDQMLQMVTAWHNAREEAKAQDDNSNGDSSGISDEECDAQEITIQADSVETFRSTVYAITSANCTNCHNTRFPNQADPDIQNAHDTVLNSVGNNGQRIVDFASPDNSRLVSRLRADMHQCWTGDCNADANTMRDAIAEWNRLRSQTRTVASCTSSNGIVNSTEPISNGEEVSNQNGGNFSPDQAVVIAPFVLANGYIENPNQVGRINANDASGGEARFNFTVDTAGEFEVLAETYGLDGGTDSFFVKIDDGPYEDWHVNNYDAFALVPVTQTSNRDARTFNLGVGNHTVYFRQRESRTKLRNVIVKPVGADNPEGGSGSVLLTFDLSQVSGRAGARLEMNFRVYDDYSYDVSNVRVVNGQGLYVKDLKIYVNGLYNPQHSTFTIVDRIISSNDEKISDNSMILLKDLGEASDIIGVKFEIIE